MRIIVPNIFASEEQMRDEIDSYFQNPDSDYYSSEEFERDGLEKDGGLISARKLFGGLGFVKVFDGVQEKIYFNEATSDKHLRRIEI